MQHCVAYAFCVDSEFDERGFQSLGDRSYFARVQEEEKIQLEEDEEERLAACLVYRCVVFARLLPFSLAVWLLCN